jgi:hypothetical protein
MSDRTASAQERIRRALVELPGVTTGRRFGGEAFFFKKKFFCHFHPVRDHFYLETFLWDRAGDVARQIPGVILHPEYGGYGWVRLEMVAEKDMASGLALVEATYQCLRTIRRISIRKEKFSSGSLEVARNNMPQLRFRLKEAEKTVQVLIEAPGVKNYANADSLLAEAVEILKS